MREFAANNSGATAIEYGLIAALIALVIIGGLANLRTQLSALFVTIANAMP